MVITMNEHSENPSAAQAPTHTPALEIASAEQMSRNAKAMVSDAPRGFIEKIAYKANHMFDGPAAWIDQAWNKAQNLPKTNYDLGIKFEEQGRHRDAIRRFKMALWLDKEMHEVHFPMGMCYAALMQQEKAIEHLRVALSYDAQNEKAWFILATLDLAQVPEAHRPRTMPRDIAEPYFDNFALTYDASQTEQRYQGHVIAAEWLGKFLDGARLDYELMDLGCGTGLVGQVMHARMAKVIGVDVSRMMAMIASERRSEGGVRYYDDVMHTEIRAYMAQVTEPFCDVVSMVRTPAYLGAIDDIIAQSAKAVRSGGFVVMVYEPYVQEAGFGIVPATGKFGHSEAYIRGACEAAGLNVRALETVALYPGLEGRVCVAQKS